MKTIPVQLYYDSWLGWCVTTQDYDAEWTGDGWRGSHIEHGATPEEALQNYLDWLWEEGEDYFILEVEGPTESIEVHEWLVKRDM